MCVRVTDGLVLLPDVWCVRVGLCARVRVCVCVRMHACVCLTVSDGLVPLQVA